MIYEFTVLVDSRVNDAEADALFEAEVDDVTISDNGDGSRVAFSVDAESISDALAVALAAIQDAGLNAISLEDGDVVTATQIAERTGRSRSSIAHLIAGRRGPGGFPAPWNAEPALYSWSEVARWFAEALNEPNLPHDSDAVIIAAVSHLLKANALAPRQALAPVLPVLSLNAT